MKHAILLITSLLFAACAPETVVAPVGPQALAADNATNAQIAATKHAETKTAATFSKIAASADATRSIAGTLPQSSARVGIEGEAGIISAMVGKPSVEDQIEAANRARIVAQGNAAAIEAAYKDAKQLADANGKALADARAALSAASDELTKAQAAASKERAENAAKLAAEITRIKSEAEAEQRRLMTWILVGGGSLLIALGGIGWSVMAYVPAIGPKACLGFAGAGGLLIASSVAVNYALSHPWIVWISVVLAVVACGIAAGLVWANHHHEVERVIEKAKDAKGAIDQMIEAAPVVAKNALTEVVKNSGVFG